MDFEITEIISEIKEDYKNSIKPLVEKGLYKLAGVKLANINLAYIKPNINSLIAYSHFGLNFVGASLGLEERLREKGDIEELITFFEASLAQIELSQKTRELFPE
ncbi:MAG: hypothetical protein WC511_04840 [Candidatus Pacearchaeota archaeon]|jgi:hypothetical protein